MGRGSSKANGGGNGGASASPQPKSEVGKFILKQTGVNIEDYRDDFTKQFDGTDMIVLYWKDIPQTERTKIQQAENLYGKRQFVLTDTGAWGKAILTGNMMKQYLAGR